MGEPPAGKSPPVPLPKWMQEKHVLIAWAVCFGIVILLSFFIFVPLVKTVHDAHGNCFLYADVYGYGPMSNCSYCIAIAIILLILCSVRLAFLIIKLTKFSSPITDAASLWFDIWGVHLVIYVVDVLLILFLMVTSCLITVGLSQMCEDVFLSRSECSSEYGVLLPTEEVNTSFYAALSFSEGAAWFTFVFWLLLITIETFIMWKNNSLKEAIAKVKALVVKN